MFEFYRVLRLEGFAFGLMFGRCRLEIFNRVERGVFIFILGFDFDIVILGEEVGVGY